MVTISVPRRAISALMMWLSIAGHAAAAVAQPPGDCMVLHRNGDGSADCARIIATPGGDHLGFYVGSSGEEYTLLSFPHGGVAMQPVDLSTYGNADFPGPKTGFGVRLKIPGKPPVVVYWRAEAHKLASFWEDE